MLIEKYPDAFRWRRGDIFYHIFMNNWFKKRRQRIDPVQEAYDGLKFDQSENEGLRPSFSLPGTVSYTDGNGERLIPSNLKDLATVSSIQKQTHIARNESNLEENIFLKILDIYFVTGKKQFTLSDLSKRLHYNSSYLEKVLKDAKQNRFFIKYDIKIDLRK
jgi:hypothetical protein